MTDGPPSDRGPTRGSPNPRLDARARRQRRFWQAKYAADPTFFGARESAFARWAVRHLAEAPSSHDVVELGSGYGRDTRFLGRRGYRVVGVDLVGPAASPRPRSLPGSGPPPWRIESGEAGAFLRSLEAESVDAVCSNMFYNMEFSEAQHRALFRAVWRVLRPRGLHLYSARSVSDPWYGRGTPVGPDTFDPAPHGVPIHFFSRAYADRLATSGFEPVARVERREGGRSFPIRLWYVADRKVGSFRAGARTSARSGGTGSRS